MSQSSTIAGFLLVGFLVYITLKGELSQYKAILFESSSTSAGNSSSTGFGPSGGSSGGGFGGGGIIGDTGAF